MANVVAVEAHPICELLDLTRVDALLRAVEPERLSVPVLELRRERLAGSLRRPPLPTVPPGPQPPTLGPAAPRLLCRPRTRAGRIACRRGWAAAAVEAGVGEEKGRGGGGGDDEERERSYGLPGWTAGL
ncbi:unnamed protein product [Urochloa humidicola]